MKDLPTCLTSQLNTGHRSITLFDKGIFSFENSQVLLLISYSVSVFLFSTLLYTSYTRTFQTEKMKSFIKQINIDSNNLEMFCISQWDKAGIVLTLLSLTQYDFSIFCRIPTFRLVHILQASGHRPHHLTHSCPHSLHHGETGQQVVDLPHQPGYVSHHSPQSSASLHHCKVGNVGVAIY